MRSFITSSIIRIIKSQRMRLAGCQKMREKKNAYRILVGK
jgi:hypothetical protein